MAATRNIINGWIVVDKPAGITSADVVREVKRALRPAKIGHAGTLDPIATGVLPLALGEATKTIPYLVEAPKEYLFTVRFGEERTTDDAEGEVTETSEVRPAREEIEKALPAFIGEIQQIPPQFSAIKVKGKRAYALARKGEEVALEPRPVTVHSFALVKSSGDGERASFRVVCGKGTYIRALARDLARMLGTCGHVESIRRTRVGLFSEKVAISLAKLTDMSHSARASEALLPVMTALADIPALAVTGDEARRMRSGQPLRLPTSKSGTVRITHSGALVAIAEVMDGTAKPLRTFNL